MPSSNNLAGNLSVAGKDCIEHQGWYFCLYDKELDGCIPIGHVILDDPEEILRRLAEDPVDAAKKEDC